MEPADHVGETVRDCPFCEGGGCEECSQTGRKVRTVIDAADGITLSVSGDAPLSAEARDVLTDVARAAFEQMKAAREPGAADEFIRNPRLAFNADEADCCTCVGRCQRRADGICRCEPEPGALTLAELADKLHETPERCPHCDTALADALGPGDCCHGAEADALRAEVRRLRTCVEAALERVEVLPSEDGDEAAAILREARDGRPGYPFPPTGVEA